jgi:hypothetical protein
VSGRCAEYTALQKTGKRLGVQTVSVSNAILTYSRPRNTNPDGHRGGKDNQGLPHDFHYPIPIPYDLCPLTK